MADWVEKPRKNPPPEMTLVEIRGTDYMGEWIGRAMKKTYKKPPHKKMKPGCWRWVTESGERFCDQAVDAWRHI